MADHPLDDVAWNSLTGAHAAFAQRHGRAVRYRPGVSVFSGLAPGADEDAWADLAVLAGPGVEIVLPGPPRTPPAGWTVGGALDGVQLEGSGLQVRPDPEAVVLGRADVPEMTALVERTRPGPFEPETYLMGTYLGIRRDGVLVAMAGERMRPPGWSEISAVCTDEEHRGHGFASRLVRAVGAVIRERGDIPFLHAAGTNTSAIGLYEHMGFTLRTRLEFAPFRTPSLVPAE